jgi:hypothetical protein
MMNYLTTPFKTLLTLCLLGALTACGGGGGNSAGSSSASVSGTIDRTFQPAGNQQPKRSWTPPTTTTTSTAKNIAPTLKGTPRAAIKVGDQYWFKPVAYDANGDRLTFRVRNCPAWLSCNAADGSLSGTPTMSDIGTDNNIVITANDGAATASIGPFSIVVNNPTAVQTRTKKYNPGHYIELLRYQTSNRQKDNYLTDTMRPGVKGVLVRYYWRDLEKSPGVYDFSAIQHDLNLLSGQGMHLIVAPEDKTFTGSQLLQPMPDYMAKYTVRNNMGGMTAERWKPYVIDRWVKLMEAMGKRFDGNPYFEGIATHETALSIDNNVLTQRGYTPEIYRDGLIDLLKRTANAFPTSRIFWYMNFFPMRQDYIAQIASAVAPYGVAMGGPDVLPDEPSISSLAYPFYDQFEGTMPLFCAVMLDSYKHVHRTGSYPTKYWTMPELFRFARDELHLNYMFWTSVSNSYTGYDTHDAYPVIERNPVINP